MELVSKSGGGRTVVDGTGYDVNFKTVGEWELLKSETIECDYATTYTLKCPHVKYACLALSENNVPSASIIHDDAITDLYVGKAYDKWRIHIEQDGTVTVYYNDKTAHPTGTQKLTAYLYGGTTDLIEFYSSNVSTETGAFTAIDQTGVRVIWFATTPKKWSGGCNSVDGKNVRASTDMYFAIDSDKVHIGQATGDTLSGTLTLYGAKKDVDLSYVTITIKSVGTDDNGSPIGYITINDTKYDAVGSIKAKKESAISFYLPISPGIYVNGNYHEGNYIVRENIEIEIYVQPYADTSGMFAGEGPGYRITVL